MSKNEIFFALLATLTITTAGQSYDIERIGMDVATRLVGLIK
jgi:membrane protein YdbS with pleckstrin-like domain